MKIGQTFKYRYSGCHEDVTLCILHDYKTNQRYLYNIDLEVKQGNYALLHAKPDRILTRKEINELYNLINGKSNNTIR